MAGELSRLTDIRSAADAYRCFSRDGLWDLFDGDRVCLNIAHECLDRHPSSDPAVTVVRDGARPERYTFGDLAVWSGRFANWLRGRGIAPGDRVGVMLDPSLAFYAATFGAMKAGAVAVPLFTLFGPDGLRLRIDDCAPRILIVDPHGMDVVRGAGASAAVAADETFLGALGELPSEFEPATSADDLALLQYTSGTTRERPEAVPHAHRAVVTVMLAALCGLGLRPGDRYFCPSSPAWGHGMWHGTISPLALGVSTGAWAGKFSAESFLDALEELEITNLAAASTVYRMLRACSRAERRRYRIAKLSYTGEPMDGATAEFVERVFATPPCSMYGTTETGVILVNFPGAPDFHVKPGALGKPMPGMELAVHDARGERCAAGVTGQIVLRRRDRWVPTRDLGWVDEDGYFHHAGRADDVIISAGWTMGPGEIEDILLRHPAVLECAVIGVPDALRGHVVRAYVVASAGSDDALAEELEAFTRERLSQHEYPRQIVFVDALPRTPAGKVNRRALREQERAERERPREAGSEGTCVS